MFESPAVCATIEMYALCAALRSEGARNGDELKLGAKVEEVDVLISKRGNCRSLMKRVMGRL